MCECFVLWRHNLFLAFNRYRCSEEAADWPKVKTIRTNDFSNNNHACFTNSVHYLKRFPASSIYPTLYVYGTRTSVYRNILEISLLYFLLLLDTWYTFYSIHSIIKILIYLLKVVIGSDTLSVTLCWSLSMCPCCECHLGADILVCHPRSHMIYV